MVGNSGATDPNAMGGMAANVGVVTGLTTTVSKVVAIQVPDDGVNV